MAPTARAEIRHLDSFGSYLDSFVLSLQADNRSPNTIRTYKWALLTLRDWLASQGRSTDPLQVTRDDARGWMAHMLATGKETSAAGAFAAASKFFHWLLDEEPDLIEHSPLERMKAPKIHDKPVEFVSADEVKRLLKACAGTDFEGRRDTAVIRIGIDSGLRRSEFAWLAIEDVDLPNRTLTVKGKGGHLSPVYIGARAAQALDRYLRVRARHPHAGLVVERIVNGDRQHVQPLFLSDRGGITGDGIYEMVRRRARQAGIERNVNVHQLRHYFADSLKSSGATDEDTMRLGRWRDPRIMRKYASSAADRRAQETHRRLSPGDRV